MSLIGLVGTKGVGKDTVADYLVENYGYTKRAFADPLKKVCQALYDLKYEQLHDPVLKEQMDERWNLSPRQMMQIVGTDIVRKHFGSEFWINHMENKVDGAQNIVISDVRFQNEADFVKAHEGLLVRITRPSSSHDDQHASEVEQADIYADVVIDNSQDKDHLFTLLTSVL